MVSPSIPDVKININLRDIMELLETIAEGRHEIEELQILTDRYIKIGEYPTCINRLMGQIESEVVRIREQNIIF